MDNTRTAVTRDQLAVIVALARALERMEASTTGINPGQYAAVVGRLSEELVAAPVDATLRAVFAASPATADLYENLQYRHAGLCLRALDVALPAEMLARQAISRVSGRATRPQRPAGAQDRDRETGAD